MKKAIAAIQITLMQELDTNFNETWTTIGEDLQHKLLRGLFQYLRFVCDDSDFHQRIYAMLLGIFQNLVHKAENPAWEILHQFILDRSLPISGRNNAVWIVLGLFGQLLSRPPYQEFVDDCIFMLLQNMTTGVQLDQVSLNISFYEHLVVDSSVKQPGIGLFALLGVHMPLLWPICCRQLQRLMDEEVGLLKTIKILIGIFDYGHSEEFIAENTQECDDLVAGIVERADNNNMVLNLSHYVNWIQEAHMRDHNDEGYTSF